MSRPYETAAPPRPLPDEEPRGGAIPSDRRLERDDRLRHGNFSAFFGDTKRNGDWSVPDSVSAHAWFGSVELDFRHAEWPADGIIDIDANGVFGDVKLLVPRGTEVEMNGDGAFFGEVSRQQKGKGGTFFRKWILGDDDPDDPEWEPEDDEEPFVVRVQALAVFGAVTVIED